MEMVLLGPKLQHQTFNKLKFLHEIVKYLYLVQITNLCSLNLGCGTCIDLIRQPRVLE